MGNTSKNHRPGGHPRHVPVMSDLAVASALSAPAMLAAVVALHGSGEVLLSFDQLAYIADHVDLQVTHLPTGMGVKLTTVVRPGVQIVEAPPAALDPAEAEHPDVPPGMTHAEALELQPGPEEDEPEG